MRVSLLVASIAGAGLLVSALALSGTGYANSSMGRGTAVVAQANPDAISEKRRALMGQMSKTRKALRKSAKAGKAGAAEVAQAEKIASIIGQLENMWAEGTSSDKVKKGRAKPEIWQNMGDFKKRFARLQKAAADAVKAAKAGDAKGINAAMGDTGCGGCHKRYRGPKSK